MMNFHLPLTGCFAVFVMGLSLNAQTTIQGNGLSGAAPTPNEYLGSSNGYNILFKANGTTRMTLLQSNGYLGIGTSPGYMLDVNGDINMATGQAFRLGTNRILFQSNTTNMFLGVGAGNSTSATSYNNTYLGAYAGYTSSGAGQSYNTFVGYGAGYVNTASGNTFIGDGSGAANTTGGGVFLGKDAGGKNTTGLYNVFIGKNAGYEHTIGVKNVMLGEDAGKGTSAQYANESCFIGYRAGYVSYGDYNIFIGSESGYSNTSGVSNIFIGKSAGYTITASTGNIYIGESAGFQCTGSGNVTMGHEAGKGAVGSNYSNSLFMGYNAGRSATSGGNNVFLGYQTGYQNTMGVQNTLSGAGAGYYNATGSYNTISGYRAGYGNANFSENTMIGAYAGTANTGNDNTFMGVSAGYSNTSAGSNVYIGRQSGYLGNTSTTQRNTFVGTQAGYTNTAGYSAYFGYQAGYSNSSGASNSYFGYLTGYSGTTASRNTFYGYEPGYYNTASDNTFLGYLAGLNNTTGDYNVYVGGNAGDTYADEDHCTFIGYGTDANANSYTNATALGNGAIVLGSNRLMLGNSSTTNGVYAYGAYNNISDGRFKYNVKDEVKGIEFIKKLRPVTYQLNIKQLDDFTIQNMPDSAKAFHQAGMDFSVADNKTFSGFIAQEVEQAAAEVGYKSTIVSTPTNPAEPYALAYAEFVVPLVKGMQEQQQMIEALQAEVAALKGGGQRINTSPDTQGKNEASHSIELANMNSPILYQNEPNPFSTSTVIRYFVPENLPGSAYVVFYDLYGKELQKLEIAQKGYGKIEANTEKLAGGIYSYSILIGDKVVDTKKMIKGN